MSARMAGAGHSISFAGRSGPATWQSGPRNELRHGPSTRIPLPSLAAAAACPEDTCPASHSARRPSCVAPSGHDFGSLLRHARDLAPRPVALCAPDRIVGPARLSARRSALAVEETPPFARDRDVALGALAARRPLCRAFAARHVQHLPVPSHARRFVRQRPRMAASERGGLYHAVITPALPACLADPCRRWPGGRFSAPSLPDSRRASKDAVSRPRRPATAAGSDGAPDAAPGADRGSAGIGLRSRGRLRPPLRPAPPCRGSASRCLG